MTEDFEKIAADICKQFGLFKDGYSVRNHPWPALAREIKKALRLAHERGRESMKNECWAICKDQDNRLFKDEGVATKMQNQIASAIRVIKP